MLSQDVVLREEELEKGERVTTMALDTPMLYVATSRNRVIVKIVHQLTNQSANQATTSETLANSPTISETPANAPTTAETQPGGLSKWRTTLSKLMKRKQ